MTAKKKHKAPRMFEPGFARINKKGKTGKKVSAKIQRIGKPKKNRGAIHQEARRKRSALKKRVTKKARKR